MRKKVIALAFSALLFAPCESGDAQQAAKVPRIGYLSTASLSIASRNTEAFREGLRQLGYVEGKNIVIEWRYAEGRSERLAELAAPRFGGNKKKIFLCELSVLAPWEIANCTTFD